jgi:hypothetical protein
VLLYSGINTVVLRTWFSLYRVGRGGWMVVIGLGGSLSGLWMWFAMPQPRVTSHPQSYAYAYRYAISCARPRIPANCVIQVVDAVSSIQRSMATACLANSRHPQTRLAPLQRPQQDALTGLPDAHVGFPILSPTIAAFALLPSPSAPLRLLAGGEASNARESPDSPT